MLDFYMGFVLEYLIFQTIAKRNWNNLKFKLISWNKT